MSTSDKTAATSVAAWDHYWRGADATSQPPAYLTVLADFWSGVLQPNLHAGTATIMLDAACGNGVVARQALHLATQSGATLELTCLDSSTAAIETILAQHPSCNGVVADAAQMTLPDARFDIVTSQFGLEYAGPGAFAEAARVTADQGLLVCVLHLAEGALHRECKTQLAACKEFADSGFMACAEGVFRTGYGALSGARSVAGFEREQRRFAPTIGEANEVLQRYTPDVASGLIRRCIEGVAQMQRRISHFEPDDVYRWLEGASAELAAYRQRMQAMDAAAVTASDLDKIIAVVTAAGLAVNTSDLLHDQDDNPFARRLICVRP